MTALTTSQLNTLRTQQHRARFYLSVSQPATLLTASVDGAHALGEKSLAYNAGSGSGYARIKAGQTLLVETSYGTKAVRVRGISGNQSAGTLTLAANAVQWASGQAITVLEEYRLWPTINRIYPKDENGVFYKDYSDTYTSESAATPPVCMAGPHRAGMLENGTWSFTVDLSGSYAVYNNASITSTDLEAIPTTGISILDNGDDTYTVTVTSAGQYWLEATATDSNGTTQISRRRVFAHDNDNMPYTDVSISTLSGSWQQGGWTMKADIFSEAGLTEVRDHTLVVLWFEADTYIGGATGGENILFAGYVYADSIEHNYNIGSVRFEAATIDAWLDRLAINDISLAAVRTPAAWYEYNLNMTTAQAILHLLKWHSTTLEIADVGNIMSDAVLRKYTEIAAGTIGSMAQRLGDQRQARLTSNRWGQLYWQPDLVMLDEADRVLTDVTFSITEVDAIGDRVIRPEYPQIAAVNVKGLGFDGATMSAYCAIAPGVIDVFEPGRGLTTINSVSLENQSHANWLAGRLLAQGNNPYPEVSMTFDGGYAQLFDLAPAEWVDMDVASDETPRGLVWNSQKMVARSVAIRIDPAGLALDVEVRFETEADGPDGIATNCETGYTMPAPAKPTWESVANEDAGVLVLRALASFSDTNSGCYYRDDNDSDWTAKNGALTGTDVQDQFGLVDPWWWTPEKQDSINPENVILIKASEGGKLYRTLDGGDNWTDITPVTDPPNSLSDSPAPTVVDLTFTCIAANLFVNGAFYAIAEWQNGSSDWRGWLLVSADDGLSWTWYDIFSGSGVSGTRPLWLATNAGDGSDLWLTVWRDDVLYLQLWTFSTMTYSENSLGSATQAEMEAETWTAAPFAPLGLADTVYVYGVMDDPASLGSPQHIIKSTDHGSSFSSVESGWSTDRCAAFFEDGAGNMVAVRSP